MKKPLTQMAKRKGILVIGAACVALAVALYVSGSVRVDDKLVVSMLEQQGYAQVELTGYRSLYVCPYLQRRNYARAFRALLADGQEAEGYVCHTLTGAGTIQQELPVERTIKLNSMRIPLDSPDVKP